MATTFGKIRVSIRGLSPAATLSLICVAVFILLWLVAIAVRLTGNGPAADDLLRQLMVPASLKQFAMRPWSAATYMFVHYDALHLITNLIWLYLFATIAATFSGRRRIYTLFLTGGLAGAAAFLIAGALIPAIRGNELTGASAAILSIMGFVIVTQPRQRVNLMFFGEVSVWIICLIALLFVAVGTGADNYGSHAAHAGGMLAGIVTALAAKRRKTTSPAVRAIFGQKASARGLTMSALPDNELLDMLLDKVRRSGYNSLTPTERDALFRISSKLNAR